MKNLRKFEGNIVGDLVTEVYEGEIKLYHVIENNTLADDFGNIYEFLKTSDGWQISEIPY